MILLLWKGLVLLSFVIVSGAVATDSSGFPVDDIDRLSLAGYAVHFDQCQTIQEYDDMAAINSFPSSVTSTKQFVLFRLCP
jgi:hypothetical protein